jgi:hypothetical protein
MEQVSVILPVYNGENYLESSIKSVLAQDYDFELHILDDDSTDASAEICQSTGDSRVRYVRNPGRFGLFKTLNRGFADVTTPLVRIWAQDDLMVPGSVGRFVDFAEVHSACGMVYCEFWEIDQNGARTGKEQHYETQRARTPDLSDPLTAALLFYCFGCLPGNISTVMLRRQAWQDAGGFLEGIQQAPDYDMWVRISEFSMVGFLREKLVELRNHPGQLGKAGPKEMTTVHEELPVYRRLQQRLANTVPEPELISFWRQNRGRQHVHWVMKSLSRGELQSAGRGWDALKEYGNRWRQLAFWLISLNGRFFTTPGHEFFDRYCSGALQRDSS